MNGGKKIEEKHGKWVKVPLKTFRCNGISLKTIISDSQAYNNGPMLNK